MGQGHPGAEEAAVGDIRSRGLWHKLARADIVCMALPCQITSTGGRRGGRWLPGRASRQDAGVLGHCHGGMD
eukprot:371982-Alexandrium_andersonii.AAC.1